MPLIQGCSVEAAKENYEKLKSEGRSDDQAYAITIRTALDNMNKCGADRQEELRNGELFGSD